MKKSPKIKTLGQLARVIQKLKKEGKKIILGTGVFDLVHLGHVNYFRRARALGDILIISIVDDKFVTKGPGRPVFKHSQRLRWLAAFEDVDFVILNGDYGPHKIMRTIKPHIFAKGMSDKKRFADPKSGIWKDKETIESVGGKIVFTKELPIHSTDIFKSLSKNK
jgi:rfaE bifunctional protein nucleotidyltransferase chain/domain